MKSKQFLEFLNLAPHVSNYFEQAEVKNIRVSYTTKKIELGMHFPYILPFSVFSEFVQALKELVEAKYHLNFSYDLVEIPVSDLKAYLHWVLEEYQLGDLGFTIIEDKTIFFVSEESQPDRLKTVTRLLNQLGIDYTCQHRHYEDKPVIIDEREVILEKAQPVKPSNGFNDELPKFKRMKQEDIPLTDLRDIVLNQRNVRVRGKIFDIETRMARNNTLHILSVSFFDGTDALSFTLPLNPEQVQRYRHLKIGDCIEIVGDIRFDSFSNTMKIDFRSEKAISVIDDWTKRDDTASLKRVELHTHTQMSEMDGVGNVEDYIHQAYRWGHQGIAITDHSSVQAFPKAQHTREALLRKNPDRPFKLIYGVEFNVSESYFTIVRNADSRSLHDSPYVVFDIETTGLSVQYDEIIEVAAVKVRDGVIIDRLQFFVNPHRKLSAFIMEKTHIRQNDVDQAADFSEQADRFLEFIGNFTLIAHNASFDYDFVNEKLVKLGKPALINPVIDTLDLSRSLLPDKKYYRLGIIAKHFKISYDETGAHRADYDTEVLAQVYDKLIHMEACMKLKTLEDLDDLDQSLAYQKKMKYHVTALAKNQDGLKSLFRLVSKAHTDRLTNKQESAGVGEPRLCYEDFEAERQNLIISSPCMNSMLFEIAMNKSQMDLEKAMAFYDMIEVQPLENYRPLVEQGSVSSTDLLKQIITKIVETAEKLNKRVVASGDVHYLNPEDKIFRDVYISAKGVGSGRHPLYIYNQERRLRTISPDQHFRTSSEMLEAFNWMGADKAQNLVIHQPNQLLDMIEEVRPIKSRLYTPSIDGADDKLKEIVYQNAAKLYGESLPDFIEQRLNKELDSIIKHGFGVIYYIAHLLVKKSLDDGYLVGSRGSVGSSFVAFLANITEVNPLAPHYVCPHCHHFELAGSEDADSGFDLKEKHCPKCNTLYQPDGHDIEFETFLGFKGDKVPDIDLNFSGDYQDKAHAYTKVLFGEDHVFRAGTISTVAEKTAYGYVKGYFEEMGLENSRPQLLNYLANGCTGVKRTSGQHPGGIIVVPQSNDVYDFTPIQYPANKSSAEWLTTHFAFTDIHDNLLKLDILGHVDPTAMKFLQNYSDIDVLGIPLNDSKVIKMFSSTEPLNIINPEFNEATGAIGIPEFGTGFVRGMLEKTKPTSFADLVRISGLSHGTDVWLNNALDLVERGHTLSDVIACRDDIMVYLMHKGLDFKMSFDIMESVRKGKGLRDEWKTAMKEKNVPDWYVDSCLKIKYLFPKAHAVAYVIMAVRVAWFKVYRPLVYYASFFSLRATGHEYETYILGEQKIKERMLNIQSRLNDRSKNAATNKERDIFGSLESAYEMLSRGYSFSTIDLNRSEADVFLVDEEHQCLIPPFNVVDGLGTNVAKSIVEARSERDFISIEDLQSRTQLNQTHIKKFKEFGILDHLDQDNQMSLF